MSLIQSIRRSWRRLAGLLLGLFLGLGLASPALAISCSSTVTAVSFGNVNVLSGSNPLATATATITVTCTKGLLELWSSTTACVGLEGGSSYDSVNRYLLNSTNKLSYNLYQDAAGSTIWGGYTAFTSPGPVKFSFTTGLLGGLLGSSASIQQTVYGRLAGGQSSAPVGTYNSTVTATTKYGSGDQACASLTSSSTSTFSVTATVAPNCSISATNLDFGSTATLASAINATSALTVTCTNAAPYTVSLGQGNNYSGGSNRMNSGSSYVKYALYSNAARTTAWSTSSTVSGTGTGVAQTLTVYGQVPAQTLPAMGSYSDTVVATVTY